MTRIAYFNKKTVKYEYIIYKVYSWTLNKKGDTPIANTIITLALVHFFQLATLLIFIDQIIVPLPAIWNLNKGVLGIGTLAYFVLFYFLVYKKKRWDAYVERYQNEDERQRTRGNRKVIAYLIGSILLFFISLPVCF